MPRLRFTLRSLIVLLTITCVVVALVAIAIERQRLRRALIMQYHEDGIDVRLGLRDDITSVQTWHLVQFGAHRLVQEAPKLQELKIYADCDDAMLEEISRLENLESLSISNGERLTDGGLAQIGKMVTLRELCLYDVDNITDAGMAHLANLHQLEWLELPYSPVGDDGVAHLALLPNLKILHLQGTQVTDKALEHLESAPSLRSLLIDRGKISGEAIAKRRTAIPINEIR